MHKSVISLSAIERCFFFAQEDLILQNICYLDSKATQTAAWLTSIPSHDKAEKNAGEDGWILLED